MFERRYGYHAATYGEPQLGGLLDDLEDTYNTVKGAVDTAKQAYDTGKQAVDTFNRATGGGGGGAPAPAPSGGVAWWAKPQNPYKPPTVKPAPVPTVTAKPRLVTLATAATLRQPMLNQRAGESINLPTTARVMVAERPSTGLSPLAIGAGVAGAAAVGGAAWWLLRGR